MDRKNVGLYVLLIMLIIMLGIAFVLSTNLSECNHKYSVVSDYNFSSLSCASGCGHMLEMLHTNDTNVNAKLLFVCYQKCGAI
jgi:hypothetical protein